MSTTTDDRIRLNLIDGGFIGSRPIMLICYYETELDPQGVYQAILDAVRVIPQVSGRIIEDDTGTRWLEHVPYYFAFNANERRDLSAESLLMKEQLRFEELAGMIDDTLTALGEPVLGVHVTRLERGTLLTMASSHAGIDAEAGRMFTTVVMASLMGAPLPSPSPQRSFEFQRRGERRGKPVEHYTDHPLQRAGSPRSGGISTTQLAGATIDNSLKALAGTPCTSHDVLAAWIIKELGSWFLPGDLPVNVRIPINLRPLLEELDANYVGNAIVDCACSWSKEELARLDPSEVAIAVRDALIRTKDPSYLNERIHLDEHGLNYDGFIGEGTQGFDPEHDLIISSVGEMQASLGGPGMPKIMFAVPAVPLCAMVLKAGDDYLLQLFHPRLTRGL